MNSKFWSLFLVVLSISACGKKPSDASDAVTLAVESIMGGVNSSLSDGEQSAEFAQASFQGSSFFIPSAYAATCGLDRFTPAIGSASCAGTSEDRTVTSSLNGCTFGYGDRFSLQGSVQLSFDSAATCSSWVNGGALPTSGQVVRTTTNLVRLGAGGFSVSMSSDPSTNYLGETIGGGVTTQFAPAGRTVTISGLHREGHLASGARLYDHTIHTPSPIVTSGTRVLGNRTISSGQVRVDHNLARYSLTATFSGLTWGASCCHPMSGTLALEATGSIAGNMTVDFATGTCGEARLTGTDGSIETFEMSACE